MDRHRRVIERFASCFEDHRDPDRVEHTVEELLRQRLYALALGYEDLNDHEELRSDPLLAAVVGKADPEGTERVRERDQGRALAGKSTLNRLEWGAISEGAADRYRRVTVVPEAVDSLFVDLFLDSFEEPPASIVLDLDATDDPPSTAPRRVASSTATTATTATCRSTSSAATTCSWRDCAARGSMPPKAVLRSSSASCPGSATPGPRSRS